MCKEELNSLFADDVIVHVDILNGIHTHTHTHTSSKNCELSFQYTKSIYKKKLYSYIMQ